MYSIIHSIYILSHIIPHHYICYDETGNKCNAGLTGRPVLYTEPINWPRVNFRKKKKKKKKETDARGGTERGPQGERQTHWVGQRWVHGVRDKTHGVGQRG